MDDHEIELRALLNTKLRDHGFSVKGDDLMLPLYTSAYLVSTVQMLARRMTMLWARTSDFANKVAFMQATLSDGTTLPLPESGSTLPDLKLYQYVSGNISSSVMRWYPHAHGVIVPHWTDVIMGRRHFFSRHISEDATTKTSDTRIYIGAWTYPHPDANMLMLKRPVIAAVPTSRYDTTLVQIAESLNMVHAKSDIVWERVSEPLIGGVTPIVNVW